MVFENLQYLSMKVSSLFDLFVTLKSPKSWCILSCSWCCWQVFNVKGVSSWFHNVSTYNEKVIENNFFIENSFK